MKKAQRLDKVLSMSGYGTRKEVKKLVKLGAITVNDELITQPATRVKPYEDLIQVFGETLEFYTHVYVMMNKPSGVISATRDSYDMTVIDLLEGAYSHREVFPAGRLDKDTEGLVLITDDGVLAHRLLSPRHQVPKTYYVETQGGGWTSQDIEAFEKGMDLGDFTSLPAKLTPLSEGEVCSALVEVVEGKFHQVKRMAQARGKEVAYLQRLTLGPLQLDEDLEPGQWRDLTHEEVRLLKEL